MSSEDGSAVSHAIHALTKALEAAHQHRRTTIAALYPAQDAPPATEPAIPTPARASGGAS
jgi:hypothetical protein